MRLEKAQIDSYKSFYQHAPIELTPKFNIIIGQNNAGKTALIEAIGARFQSNPTKTENTVPHPGYQSTEQSKVTLTIRMDKNELLTWCCNQRVFQITSRLETTELEQWLENLNAHLYAEALLELTTDGGSDLQVRIRSENSHIESMELPNGGTSYGIAMDTTKNRFQLIKNSYHDASSLFFSLTQHLHSLIYYFRAERMQIASAPLEATHILKPDASNLAAVLNYIQGHPQMRDRYDTLVQTVLPQIAHVTVEQLPTDRSTGEIKIWDIPSRRDLSHSFAHSGTGVGQVLSILCAVITADSSRTIIIDEPQSFLHPSAMRKLLGILQHEFSQHQYIITTHSSSVIAAISSGALFRVQKDKDGYSQVDRLDPKLEKDQRACLNEVGASFSDVFGYDRVLWVEGPTEKTCFRILIEENLQLYGVAIASLAHTGDIEGKDVDKFISLYKQLSTTGALLPKAVGIILDREKRSPQHLRELETRGKAIGLDMAFLSRRMYENYLLDSKAIAFLIDELREELSKEKDSASFMQTLPQCSVENIAARIEEKKDDYIENNSLPLDKDSEKWKVHIHGAKLLDNLIRHFVGNGYCYKDNKIAYGEKLTRWLSKNNPGDLEEILTLLKSKLSRSPQ